MRLRATATLLVAMLVLGACGRTSSKSDVTSDPPEAFTHPQVSVQLNQTDTWGGFKLEVREAGAKGRSDSRDVNLTVDVGYTNLRSEGVDPPSEVTFEFAGKRYPAKTGQIELPGDRFVDGPIPAGVTADPTIAGTLTDAATSKLPSGDELRAILVKTRLVFGAPGAAQAVFPFG